MYSKIKKSDPFTNQSFYSIAEQPWIKNDKGSVLQVFLTLFVREGGDIGLSIWHVTKV